MNEMIIDKALDLLTEWELLNTLESWTSIGEDTQYKIIEHETEVHLLFQWSTSWRDWLFNLDFAVMPYKNQPVVWHAHRGFVKVWKTIQDVLHVKIHHILNERKLIIMGYSHGGSLSVLAHEFFQYNGYNPETYAFAGFRACWNPSLQIRNRFTKLYTIRNSGDIITHFPLKLFGWRHVGNILNIGTTKFISPIPHFPKYYRKALEAQKQIVSTT